MPTENPSSKIKHITTHAVSNEYLEQWKAFPGVRAIALHLRGKKAERPHYHIWWESDTSVTNEEVKDRLRAFSDLFAKPFQNWKFTVGSEGVSHFVTWSNYVVDGAKGSMVLYETPDDTHPPLPKIPIVAVGGAGATTAAPAIVRLPSNRAPQRVRFVAHLKSLNWREGDVKAWNMYEKLDEIVNELTEWAENAFTTPNGAVVVQHALWTFADEAARNVLKVKNQEAIRKSIRLF